MDLACICLHLQSHFSRISVWCARTFCERLRIGSQLIALNPSRLCQIWTFISAGHHGRIQILRVVFFCYLLSEQSCVFLLCFLLFYSRRVYLDCAVDRNWTRSGERKRGTQTWRKMEKKSKWSWLDDWNERFSVLFWPIWATFNLVRDKHVGFFPADWVQFIETNGHLIKSVSSRWAGKTIVGKCCLFSLACPQWRSLGLRSRNEFY